MDAATCNQCALSRIELMLQSSGFEPQRSSFFKGSLTGIQGNNAQCKTMCRCCEMREFRMHACPLLQLVWFVSCKKGAKYKRTLIFSSKERARERNSKRFSDGSRLYHHRTRRERLNYTATVTSRLQTCYYRYCVNQLEGEANWVCPGMCVLCAHI